MVRDDAVDLEPCGLGPCPLVLDGLAAIHECAKGAPEALHGIRGVWRKQEDFYQQLAPGRLVTAEGGTKR